MTTETTEAPQKLFDVRLSHPADGNDAYRVVTIAADDADEARFIAETKERAICAHKLDEDELKAVKTAQVNAKAAKTPLAEHDPSAYSALLGHEQDKPYKIISVKEVEGR